MPTVSLTLEDTNRSILSQAYFKIIKDIVSTVKIPHSALVAVQKDMEVSLTDNRHNATSSGESNLPSTVADRRITAVITEDYNEDELTTTAVHQQNVLPIFIDPEVSVSVYPVYVKSDISIEFSFVSPSKTEANRIRDDIRIRLSQTRNINIHELEYTILIPEVVEEFISDVYDLKNRLQPQPLLEYFLAHTTNRVHPITDMGNSSNTKLAIQEKQVRIVGLFDFSSMPEKIDVDNENNNYKISFTYKLSMDVPRAMVMKYPVMICNRPLPAKYLTFIEEHKLKSQEEYKNNLSYTQSLYALSHFEAHRQLENRVDIKLPINVPLFDDFNIRQKRGGYAIVASFLTQVDEGNKKSLFNLKDIDPFYIPDPVLNFIKTQDRNYVITPYTSLLFFGLHQDGKHFDNDILEIDENFNVTSKAPLSLFKPVRVTLSVCIDLSTLPDSTLRRLRNYPDAYLIYLSEVIRAINNYKTELANSFGWYEALYRELMYLLMTYFDAEQWDLLYRLLGIIMEDGYLAGLIGRGLLEGYPIMYEKMYRLNVLTVVPGTFDIIVHYGQEPVPRTIGRPVPSQYDETNRRGEYERLTMKTVMDSRVTALRNPN